MPSAGAVTSAGRHRPWAWVPGVIAGVIVAAGIGWAGATLFRPVDDPLDATTYTYATVEQGDVEASLNLDTVAAWEAMPVGSNQAAGVVTGIAVTNGDELGAGSELYSVNLRPVVIAVGDVPAFRAISSGTEGADVTQLQGMLQGLGYYGGGLDGKAQAGTERAIRAWQKALDVEQTGVVEAGDVIYVPTLPSRIALDTEVISRGAALSGGELAVRAMSAAPRFTIPATDTQAQRMPAGTRVEIFAPDGSTWEAVTSEQRRDEETQTIQVALTSPDGGSPCGDQCSTVAVDGETQFAARIVTVPAVGGLVIPSAALVTGVDGQIAVIDEAGESLPVKVIASASGMSVIEGVEDGLRVRVPAEGAG